MGKYTRKFIKSIFFTLAIAILFFATIPKEDQQAINDATTLATLIFIVGVLLSGILSVLGILENKDEDDEGKKQLLKD